jgi:hypothetical protein
MVCHWPGIYFNGEEIGFNIFKDVVKRLRAAYDNLVWMKFSELGRYWAAKELTKFERSGAKVEVKAPFACPGYTVGVTAAAGAVPRITVNGQPVALKEVPKLLALESGTWTRTPDGVAVCFDLPKGPSHLEVV